MSKRKYEYVSSTAFPAPGKISRRKFQQYKSRPVRKLQSVARTRGALVRNPERKYFDTGLADGALVTATSWAGSELDPATYLNLCSPQTGSDINQRIGRKIAVSKITIRGQVYVPAMVDQSAGHHGVVVRLILYQDMQTNAAQCQGETLMSGTSPSHASNLVNTFQNTAGFGRFRVLKDKTMYMDNPVMARDATNFEQQGLVRPFKFSVKFSKPVVVHFNGADGGSVADIVDNSFHMIGAQITSTLHA